MTFVECEPPTLEGMIILNTLHVFGGLPHSMSMSATGVVMERLESMTTTHTNLVSVQICNSENFACIYFCLFLTDRFR